MNFLEQMIDETSLDHGQCRQVIYQNGYAFQCWNSYFKFINHNKCKPRYCFKVYRHDIITTLS